MAILILTIAQKGGTGKTTTTQNLAALMAHELDARVLMIDADPQNNLSESFWRLHFSKQALGQYVKSLVQAIYSQVPDAIRAFFNPTQYLKNTGLQNLWV